MSIASHLHEDVFRYLENVLSRQDSSKMSCRYLENVSSRQDISKTVLRCLEDVLCRLGTFLYLIISVNALTSGAH